MYIYHNSEWQKVVEIMVFLSPLVPSVFMFSLGLYLSYLNEL